MRFRNTHRRTRERGELEMTATIDIVFLLLIFFILTFRIVSPEGEFQIAMPQRPDSGPTGLPPDIPPVPVRLSADADGQLAGIMLGERPMQSFEQLRAEIRGLVDSLPAGFGPEVDLICDEQLNFEHAMDAITAVSGYLDDGQIVKLIEKIRFQPTHRRTGDG